MLQFGFRAKRLVPLDSRDPKPSRTTFQRKISKKSSILLHEIQTFLVSLNHNYGNIFMDYMSLPILSIFSYFSIKVLGLSYKLKQTPI